MPPSRAPVADRSSEWSRTACRLAPPRAGCVYRIHPSASISPFPRGARPSQPPRWLRRRTAVISAAVRRGEVRVRRRVGAPTLGGAALVGCALVVAIAMAIDARGDDL